MAPVRACTPTSGGIRSGTNSVFRGHPRAGYLRLVPVLRTLDLVLLLSLLIIAVGLVPASQVMLQIYLGIKSRRLVDATTWAPPPPAPVTELMQHLARAGLKPLGVRAAALVGNRRRFEWNLVDESTTTYVSLIPAPAVGAGVLMVCHTAFADGSFVATYYPTGVQAAGEKLVAVSTSESPDAALVLHHDTVAAFSADHGAPLQNRSMADLVERDATYRRLHGGAAVRGRAYAYVGMAALLAMACGITIARLIVLD